MARELEERMSSAPALLIGVDIGTTNLKAVALRPSGRVEAVARRPMAIKRPQAGAAEFDLDALDRDIVAVLKDVVDVLSIKGISAKTIAGLGVASIGESFVGLDRDSRKILPCPTWYDRRTRNLREQWGLSAREWFDITGMVDDDIYTGYRLDWWRREYPDAFAEVDSWLMVADYAVYRLCGAKVAHPSLAARSGLADRRTGEWSQDLLDALGVPADRLPELKPAATVAGALSEWIAQLTGLPPGLPVVNSGHDHPCAGLGCGLVDPGRMMDSTGTAESINTVVTSPLTFAQVGDGAYDCFPHAVGGRFLLSGHTPASGAFLDWLISVLSGPAAHAGIADLLWQSAAAEPPGCHGLQVTPYLAGTGAPWNRRDIRADLSMISHATSAGAILRAGVEALAAWLALNLTRVEAITGVTPAELTVTGGGARNELANAIKAAMVRRPLIAPSVEEAAGAGAGLVAGLATGLITDASELANLADVSWRRIEVDADLVEAYSALVQPLQSHLTPQDGPHG